MEEEHEVKPFDPRRFGDMYDLAVREDGYRGTYEQFVQKLMAGLNRLSRWEDKRTIAERRLDWVKGRIGGACERGMNKFYADKAAAKKKSKRRKAVLKKHR